MKRSSLAALIALVLSALAASADDKPLLDKVDDSLADARKSVKAGAKKAEDGTNQALEKGRKSGKKSAAKAEQDANDAARALREKLGTEK